MSDLVICEKCHEPNAHRNIFCKRCGNSLRDELYSADQTLYVGGQPEQATSTLRHRRAYFGREAKLYLRLIDLEGAIACDLSRNTLTLGRKPEDPNAAHINLSEFGAKELGVSRKHARLTRLNAIVMIDDLGALNGTYVNGERLSPNKPCVLCQGDELCLGNLRFEVLFE